RHGNRQLLLDQLQHADVTEIALAEIEPREIPYHQREAFGRWLVEAELFFEALDEIGIEPLRAPVFRTDRIRRRADLAAGAEIAAARTRNPRGASGIGAGELRDHAFHRAAGCELHHDERNEHYPEHG